MGHRDQNKLGYVPTRGFWGTWLFLFQRHFGLLALFIVCVSVLVGIILSVLPPLISIQKNDYLSNLVIQSRNCPLVPPPFLSFLGFTYFDSTNWLNPNNLGLKQIVRATNRSAISSFDPSLWSKDFIRLDDLGNWKSRKALPTNAWWQPWVIPPGTGSSRSINQLPYVLEVISKKQTISISSFEERAGLQIMAPYPKFVTTSDQNYAGLEQQQDSKQIGLILGVRLKDFGDYVIQHYIEDYSPLEVVKRWDLSLARRDDNGVAALEQEKLNNSMFARITRGSAFITMTIPNGVYFIVDTIMSDISKAIKNTITRIHDLSASTKETAFTCFHLSKTPMTTDAFEVFLQDKTRWVVIFDQKITFNCLTIATGDRLQSSAPLKSSLLVRVAIVEMSEHEDVVSGNIPDASIHKSNSLAKRKLLGHIKKETANSVSRFVSEINRESGDVDDVLQRHLTKFPLRDQLRQLSTKMNFTLTESRWNDNELIDLILKTNPSIIIFPDRFIEDPDVFYVSEAFKEFVKYERIMDHGMTLLGLAGTQTRSITKLFDVLLGIELRPAGVWDPYSDALPRRTPDILRTIPAETDRTSVRADVLPKNMPQSLSKPNTKNRVEMMNPYKDWPLVSYCRPSRLGSSESNLACDGAIHGFFNVGSGSAQWIGMDWVDGVESIRSGWSKLLARAITSSGCTEGMKAKSVDGSSCTPVENVVLVLDVDVYRQQEDLSFLKSQVIKETDVELRNGTTKRKEVMDLSKTINFLKGTQEEMTFNINQESVISPHENLETLRDFVLRHALTLPVASTVKADMEEQSALLSYVFEVKMIKNLKSHSLNPPFGKGTSDLLWDPYRLMIYLNRLQTKLEYATPIGYIATIDQVSLEDDRTTCLASVAGPLCARSFGPAPNCQLRGFFEEATDSRPLCERDLNGTLSLQSWNLAQIHETLLAGNSVLFSHLSKGANVGLLINYPMANWDLHIRLDTGLYKSLVDSIHPEWKEKLRWATMEDVDGTWKLDGKVWAKKNAADDLNVWVRMIHRYAQLAIAADIVGLRSHKWTAIKWLEDGLMSFFSNKFDNQGLLYDATWGGVIPCGCDRDTGKKFCVPSPRMGYFDSNKDKMGLSGWLSIACPAATKASSEGGAGFFVDHHSLWGYVVYSVAVAARYNPSFVNRRVRLLTEGGISRPKIHHLVLALIQDYANPMLISPLLSSAFGNNEDLLHRFYPAARYKDWWRLHSYGSAMGGLDGYTPSQYSLTEAAFGYWAASLYAGTIQDDSLKKWSQLLAGMELIAGNAFWHVKENTETMPSPLRYLGAIGKVSEKSVLFQTRYGASQYEVFHSQVVPLNLLSFEVLDPGWVLWMNTRWKAACQNDMAACSKAGADLGLLLLDMLAKDWKDVTSIDALSAEAILPNATRGIQEAVSTLANAPCFQMGSFDCGIHTLTNSVLWAALAYTWGGVLAATSRDDGNGRFQIF